MSFVLNQATKGQPKALRALYNNNKQLVCALVQALLPEQQEWEPVVVSIFRDAWAGLKKAKPENNAQFKAYLIRLTVDACRKKLTKKNPKALHVPADKNFLLTNPAVKDRYDDEVDYLLANLPALHRFILVLNSIGGCNAGQICGCLHLDAQLVEQALEQQEANIQLLQSLSQKEFDTSYEQLMLKLTQRRDNTRPSAQLNELCEGGIANFAATKKKFSEKINKPTLIISAVVVVCVLIAAAYGIWDMTHDDTVILPSVEYYADIEIENYGTITVQLDPLSAPATVANFVSLAESGFYDGLTFHRIITNFMMQGGAPNENSPTPDTIVGEFTQNGHPNLRSHTRGTISMARANGYDSGSSQFFIVHKDSTHLDGYYAAFGFVVDGMEVVDEICYNAQPSDDNGTMPAESQPVIKTITIRTVEP